MGTASDAAVALLHAAIAAGTGFARWQGGIADSSRNTSDSLQLVGGSFACHPAHPEHPTGEQSDNYVAYTVNFASEYADHPLISEPDPVSRTPVLRRGSSRRGACYASSQAAGVPASRPRPGRRR